MAGNQSTTDGTQLERSEYAASLLELEPTIFATDFNRNPFPLRHNLASNPLLQLDRLVELALRLGEMPGEVYFDVAVDKVDQRWDQTPKPPMTVADVIKNIGESKAWIILRRAELDPRYRALLEQCMTELSGAGRGSWPERVRVQNAIVFITSPKRITTYHIDRECNFILQIRGTKTIYVFDQNDRDVLPEEELERFWAVDNNAARYKDQYQERAKVFHLGPGDGIHVPVNAPHWVQNGDNISITLSVNFQFKDTYRADKYRANYYLRKLGFTPAPPNSSPLRDALKVSAIRSAAILAKPLKVFRS
ncbi:MAG: cupin-like domain-containing protein [Acidobacteriaceae bacterium]